MKLNARSVYLAAPFLVFAIIADAHHSSAPHYDRDKPVVVQGLVTDWKFVNPHAYIYFDVTDENGDVRNWRCESSAATSLQRLGWTAETFLPGQKLTIKGMAARREDNVCSMDAAIFPDGTEVSRRANLNEIKLPTGIIAAAVATPAQGGQEDRPLTLASGQSNISGAWVAPPRRRGGAPNISVGGAMGEGMTAAMGMGTPAARGGNRNPEPSAAGLAASEKWDYNYDNPALFCHNANIIHGWRHDQHVNQITQTDTTVTLTYGYMDDLVRTVHLDMKEHPVELTASVAGHSIGWWEDDTLVVDTVGFAPNVYNPLSEIMHSDQMHIVERFRYDPDTRTLVRSYTVSDPLYFEAPISAQDTMQISAVPHESYGCLELSGKNNQRTES